MIRSMKELHSLGGAVQTDPCETDHNKGTCAFAVADGLALSALRGHELSRAAAARHWFSMRNHLLLGCMSQRLAFRTAPQFFRS
jgi:hypothetical protein